MLEKEYNVERVKHRIEKLIKLKEHYEQEIQLNRLSVYGYEIYGYYKGVLSELENILDILEEYTR